MNPSACHAVAASAFLMWDYCITFDDEIELIWRQKWNWVTVVFSIIRYVPIICSDLLIAYHLAPFFPPSNGCGAWSVASVAWTNVLVICFEALLIARVLALYGQHRLLRYVLITLSVCVNMARIILLAISSYKFGVENVGSNFSFVTCQGTMFASVEPSALFIIELFPEAIFFLLAVFKLMHTKRTFNIPVSQLLIIIVRDGTWAFALICAFLIWVVLQIKLSKHGGIAFTWVAPVIGSTGSRLTLNLRSKAKAPAGGTNVEAFEINFPRIDAAGSIHEIA